jgi:excisionase family DNA binding protein
MPRDESLTAATKPPLDETPTRLFELLTVADVAALLKVSKSWVYEHIRARGTSRSERLPHIKIGKYVRFDPQLVRAFLERRTAGR